MVNNQLQREVSRILDQQLTRDFRGIEHQVVNVLRNPHLSQNDQLRQIMQVINRTAEMSVRNCDRNVQQAIMRYSK